MFKNLVTQLKEKNRLDRILRIISVLCIIYVCDELLSGLLENIQDRVELSNFLNFFVKVFQNLIFGLLFVNLFCKFQYRQIGFILPFAYLEQAHNILANQFHPFLVNSGFYSLVSDNPRIISPEYPRIIIFFLILLAAFTFLFTRWRNFKRIFLTFGAGGVFFTALLFHTIIIYEINAFKAQDSEAMKEIAFYSKDWNDIQVGCAVNKYECSATPIAEAEEIFASVENDGEEDDDPVRRELPYLKPYFDEKPYFFWYGVAHDSKAKNRLLGQIPFALIKNDKFAMTIRNTSTYKEFFIVNQYVFSWLTLASHTVWFFGSLFLIYFHEKRFKKKALEMKTS